MESVEARPRRFAYSIGPLLLIAVCLMLCAPANAGELHRRIFISVDMEGIAGAVSPVQISTTGSEYEQYRRIMTQEVLAAIAGARASGATEFVIADSHGNSQNLLLELLPADAKLVRGGPRPLGMMAGLDDGKFDGAFFIGYHAGASSIGGVTAHTFSSARFSEVRLNGIPASEGYFNAAIAAEFGVPVLLVTGDDALAAELKPVLPAAEFVEVKRALSFHAAETLTPQAADRLIEDAARRSVASSGSARTGKKVKPATIDLTFHFVQPAELLAWLPGVERTGARSIRFTRPDARSAMQFLTFITSYNIGLEP